MDESRMIRSRVKPDISISDLTVPAELAVYSFDTDCVEREINEYCLKNASIEAKMRLSPEILSNSRSMAERSGFRRLSDWAFWERGQSRTFWGCILAIHL